MDDELIFSYTRKDAIADGVLVDVSEMAEETGFRFPVAVTEAVAHGYLHPTDELKDQGQSFEGRLWDLLNLLRMACARVTGSYAFFEVIFLMPEGQKSIPLKAVIGPGDEGEPVITVMLPHED